MIALKMNDVALPPVHGYPARLIVPGLYGYVSATKWLTELELTTLEAFNGYWVPLGWAKEAPILTQSRIDTPRGGVKSGTVPIAGIAWAPDRGVSRVEVAIDGVWRDARLSKPISDATWVQWVTDWTTTPGQHTIMVRATDGKGVVQEEQRSAAGARRRARLAHDRRGRQLSGVTAVTRRGPGPASFRYRVRACPGAATCSIRPSVSWPAPSAGRAIARSSCRRATAHGSSRSCSRRSRSRSSPIASPSSCPSSSVVAWRRRARSPRRPPAEDVRPLDEPLNEAFRAGSLTLGWDGDAERVLVEARAQSEDGEAIDPDEDDDEDEDGPDLLRVRITADAARSFVARAARVVAAGRPPCPLCGAPLDPQGHICPRRNGHYVN